MKGLALHPQMARFLWTYNKDECHDKDTGRVWSLNTMHHIDGSIEYYYKQYNCARATPICTRKQSAIRSLMRLIANEDKENAATTIQ